MKQTLIAAALAALAAAANAEIVGAPAPVTSALKMYDVIINPAPIADYHTVRWAQNGTVLVSIKVFPQNWPANGLFSRSIQVDLDDIICVEVTASSAGGTTAADQVCLPPALNGLPPIPEQPIVSSLAEQ